MAKGKEKKAMEVWGFGFWEMDWDLLICRTGTGSPVKDTGTHKAREPMLLKSFICITITHRSL